MKKTLRNILVVICLICLCFSLTSCLKSRTVEGLRKKTGYYEDATCTSFMFDGKRYVLLPTLTNGMSWNLVGNTSSLSLSAVTVSAKEVPLLLTALFGTSMKYYEALDIYYSDDYLSAEQYYCSEERYNELCDEMEDKTPGDWIYSHYNFEKQTTESVTVPQEIVDIIDAALQTEKYENKYFEQASCSWEKCLYRCTKSGLFILTSLEIIHLNEDIYGDEEASFDTIPTGYYVRVWDNDSDEYMLYKIDDASKRAVHDFLESTEDSYYFSDELESLL